MLDDLFTISHPLDRVVLNPEQREAAASDPTGLRVVLAGAGTGKTTLLLAAAGAAVHDTGQKGLLLVFNASVKDELRARLTQLYGSGFPLDAMTNHGLALKLVMANKSYLGLPETAAIEGRWFQLVKDLKAAVSNELNVPCSREQVGAILHCDRLRRTLGNNPGSYAGRYADFLKSFSEKRVDELADWMYRYRVQSGQLAFHDLLYLANRLPSSCFRGLGYAHLFVDEAQDLNEEQHQLVRKLFDHAQGLMFIGDVSQAIYRFAGARPDLLLDLRDRYPTGTPFQRFVLPVNYRSTQAILDVANELTEGTRQAGETAPRLVAASGERGRPPVTVSSPHMLLRWMRCMYEQCATSPESTVILYRCNKHSLEIERLLAQSGMPYRFQKGACSFVEQQAVQDVLAYLRLALNEEVDEADWDRVLRHTEFLGAAVSQTSWEQSKGDPLNFPWQGSGGPQGRGMSSIAPSGCRSHGQKNAFWETVRLLKGFSKTIQEMSAEKGLINTRSEAAIGQFGRRLIDERLKPAWRRRFEDDDDKYRDALDLGNSVINWLTKLWGNARQLLEQAEQLRMHAGSTSGILLSTVHKFKGLEADTAIIWNPVMGSFPLGHSSADPLEEACLQYVAASRARRFMVLAFASASFKHAGPGHSPIYDAVQRAESLQSP